MRYRRLYTNPDQSFGIIKRLPGLTCQLVQRIPAAYIAQGKIGTGILKLLTLGAFGIWSIIDIVLIAIKKLDDKEGMKLA